MKSNSQRHLLHGLDPNDLCYRIAVIKETAKDPIIAFRLRVIKHQTEYGWRSTCSAFQISQSTLYRWRQIYLQSGGSAATLRKKSTRPHRFRSMQVDPALIMEIKRLRKKYYRLGKVKLKYLLDRYCQENNLPAISISTIGKVINRHNLFFQKSNYQVYHNPNHRYAQRKRIKRDRVRYSWRAKDLGHLQMDTVVKFIDTLKRYAISVMDIKSKFTLTLVYPNLNSTNALDTLIKFQEIYPVPIKSLQTDNGLEFLGGFDQYLKRNNIKHLFTYPRCPQVNGFIERYNRSFQEEFLDLNLDLIHHPRIFHDKLLEYLIFFNTKRVHQGLNNQTPMDYLLKQGYFSQKCATRTST